MYTFMTHSSRVRVQAKSLEHAWEKFTTSGYMEIDCIAVIQPA